MFFSPCGIVAITRKTHGRLKTKAHLIALKKGSMKKKKNGAPAPVVVPPSKPTALEPTKPTAPEPTKHPWGPPTPGPLSVYTPSGKLITSSKPTLEQCIMEIATLVDQPTAMMITENKGDAAEFAAVYNGRNRDLSEANVAKLLRRMDSCDFYAEYPSKMYMKNGFPCEGGHTNDAFLRSKRATIQFCVVAGIDPRMNTRGGAAKYRDLIDQTHYFEKNVLVNITKKKEQRSFTTSVGTVFALAASHDMWNIGLRYSEAKKEVCQHKVGMRLVERMAEPFCEIRDMLTKAAVDEETNTINLLKRLVFYVPSLILYEAGYKNWPRILAVGDGVDRKDPLAKGNRWLSGIINLTPQDDDDDNKKKAQTLARGKDGKTKKIEFTIRREQGDNMHTIVSILCYAYAKATGKALEMPLQRYEIPEDGGQPVFIYETYTDHKKTKDNKFQAEVVNYFLRKMPDPSTVIPLTK